MADLSEFRQLVEKQHAVVREGDLSRAAESSRRPRGETEEAVWCGLRKGRCVTSGCFGVGQTRDGVDLRRLQRLLLRSCPAGSTAAAARASTCPSRASRRAARCARPRRRSPSARLTFSCPMTSAKSGTGAAVRLRRRPRRGRRDRLLAREVAHQLKDVFNRVDREPTRERRLGGVLRRDIEGLQTPAAARTAPSVARPSPGAAPP